MTIIDKDPKTPADDGDIPLKPVIAPNTPNQRDLSAQTTPISQESAKMPPKKKNWGEKLANVWAKCTLYIRDRKKRALEPKVQTIFPAPWKIAEEPKWGRYVAAVVVLVGLTLFAYVVRTYHSGAHGGIDQNGYHRTAQLIADQGAIGWRQGDPYEYSGKMNVIIEPYGDARRDAALKQISQNMMIEAADRSAPLAGVAARLIPQPEEPVHYMTYAKYPFGYPLLAAVARWFVGFDGMYWVNPICTVAAVGFAYMMFRQVLRRFTSIVGAILLAMNPLTLYYANDGNSHASTLMCVCLGFWGLLSWMRTHDWWRGMLGGFALGYACTIRYSEFLLVLPVAFVAGSSLLANSVAWYRGQGKPGAARIRSMTDWLFPVVGWLIPIATLAIVCHYSFGGWGRNGYTYCNEDTGFEWRFLIYGALGMGRGGFGGSTQGNWETLILQLNRQGLFIMWPIAFIGLIGMFSKLPRVGFTLGLWVLPSIFLYMLYYWAPAQETTVGYLRFFVSVIPGLIFAGLWMIERAMDSMEGNRWASLTTVTIFAVMLLVISGWIMLDNEKKFLLDSDETFMTKTLTITVQSLAGMLNSFKGWMIVLTIAGFVGMIWWKERGVASQRAALALSLGIGAMLACGMNLMQMVPTIEGQHVNWTQLRMVVDEVRHTAPAGSVLFTDEPTARQLDAIGGYRLYSSDIFATSGGGGGGGGRNGGGGGFGSNLFSGGSALFSQSASIVSRHEQKMEQAGDADPNPYQFERARYYMELFGKPTDTRTLIDPTPAELAFNAQARLFGIPPLPQQYKVTTKWASVSSADVEQAEVSRWEKAFREGRRVFYIAKSSEPTGVALARRRDYLVSKVDTFRTVDAPVEAETVLPMSNRQGQGNQGRGGRAGFGGAGGGGFGRGSQQGAYWTIYEIKAPKPVPPKPVIVTPAPTPVTPTTPTTPTAPSTPATPPQPALPTYRPGTTIFD